MITEDYVSFETAKLLKEKGFDIQGYASIKVFGGNTYEVNKEWITPTEDTIIPTLQMAMKWLREVHGLFIFISTWLKYKDGTVQYYYEIRNLNDEDFETLYDYTSKELNSFEKVAEAAIKYCLEKLV